MRLSRLEPRDPRRRPAASDAGRVCAVVGCGTVLSRYNPESTCAQHAPSDAEAPDEAVDEEETGS